MADLEIKNPATIATFNKISQDIDELENILKNVLDATNTLDASKWDAREKRKIDQEYVPYLNKISVDAPGVLRKKLAFAREAIAKYEQLDQDIANKANTNLEDLDFIDVQEKNS